MTEREATLGTGRVLALFFGVVVLCALFFAAGYKLGRASLPATAGVTNSGGTAAGNLPAVSPALSSSPTGAAVPATAPPAPVSSPATSAPPSTQAAAPGPTAGRAPASSPPTAGKTSVPTGYTVQVAAVSKQQDADALADALRKKQYSVLVVKVPTDTLFHVQIGPFDDAKNAEAVRNRLIKDGYNPILKK